MRTKRKCRRLLTASILGFVLIAALIYLCGSVTVINCLNSSPHGKSPASGDSLSMTESHYVNVLRDLSDRQQKEERLQRLQSACADDPGAEGHTENILVYEDRKSATRMSYCVVPKAGCTFWIRVFRFLNNDTAGLTVRTPFDMDRFTAHDSTQRRLRLYRLQNAADRDIVANSTRFMFARDPYSRIWSSYIDKLLLPNMWETTGKLIAARRRNASAQERLCGNDVSFREFVTYIVHEAETKGSESLNGHWRPIKQVCDPCIFKPHFLGKQETFMGDTEAILKHFRLQDLLRGYHKLVQLRAEVSSLTDFNYYFFRSLSLPDVCRDPALLGRRLWTAFRLNGILPLSASESLLGALPSPTAAGSQWKAAFTRLVFQEQDRRWEELIAVGGLHRRRMMLDAYRALPATLLDKFVQIYRQDFDDFGYEKRPEDIFLFFKPET